MLLVEQSIIKEKDDRFVVMDQAAFASKNLYNLANYTVRQSFIFSSKYIPYKELYQQMKDTDAYKALPAKVSQWVLKQVDHDWITFFAANKAYKADASKFTGKPRIPKYKDKLNGRNLLTYTVQAVSKKYLKEGVIKPSGLEIEIPTQQRKIQQVRIVPRSDCYVVEVIYEAAPVQADINPDWKAGMDIGVDILAAVTSNKPGFKPLLVNGRPLKSTNQLYNKSKAEMQSKLENGKYGSRRIRAATGKRNRRVRHYLHAASRQIVDLLVSEKISTLVIGKNKQWKDEINLGKRNNQNFVSIPHGEFIDMLVYKCEMTGISVILTEESYTSKCSFFDCEPIGKHEAYAGRRTKRGLFVTSSGKRVHADVNGSYNIVRKVFPDVFTQGIEGLVAAPARFYLRT